MSVAEVCDIISHRCDGPITDFVLISRAIRLAGHYDISHSFSPEDIAEALHQELSERGFLTDADPEIPGS